MILPLLFVLGPRRSGTNFIEQLLLDNVHCRVADLNRNPIRPQRPERPNLFHEVGNKHDVDAANLKKMAGMGKVIAQSRNPVDWLVARCRYQYLIDKETAAARIEKDMSTWLEREYFAFWRVVLNIRADVPREALVIQRYEDLVNDPGAAILRLSEELGVSLRHRMLKAVTKEVRPGGNLGETFRQSGDPFFRYPRADHQAERAVVRDNCCHEILAQLDYKAR